MSLEKIVVTKCYKSDKNKAGVKFKTKTGKPFWKVAIQTDKFGEEWFSALCFREDAPEMNFEVGSEYSINIWEENGFKNFSLPTKTDMLEIRVETLEKYVREIVAKIKSKDDGLTSAGTKVPDFSEVNQPKGIADEINPSEIPF